MKKATKCIKWNEPLILNETQFNPKISLIPDVLKWNVIIISANLYVNEKLHLRLFLAKSVNVANVGIGGFSSIGVN